MTLEHTFIVMPLGKEEMYLMFILLVGGIVVYCIITK